MDKEQIKEKSREFANSLSNNEITAEELKQSMSSVEDSVDVAKKHREDMNKIRSLSSSSHEESSVSSRKLGALNKLASLMSKPSVYNYELPCGIPDFGKILKKFQVVKMLGTEKRRLQAKASAGNVIAFKDGILESTLISIDDKYYNFELIKRHKDKLDISIPENAEKIDSKLLSSMPTPDRSFITWQSIKLGNQKDDGTSPVLLKLPCPACSTENSFVFDMSKPVFETAEDKGLFFDSADNCWKKEVYNKEFDIEFIFRLPDGNAQNQLLKKMSNNKLAEGLMELTEYCILYVDGIHRDDFESKLGFSILSFLDEAEDGLLIWIDEQLSNLSPGIKGRISFDCSNDECTYHFDQEVDVESFLFQSTFKKTRNMRG